MTSRHFEASINYNWLEDAIEAVLHESHDDVNNDFAIVPPSPIVVTDEEEGADEDMVTSSLPRDFLWNNKVLAHSLDSDEDSSDEELLGAKRL